MSTLPPVGPLLGEHETAFERAATRRAGEADCRTCGLRSRCISYGWRSPGGLWFENAVVLRPPPGCRGYVGLGPEIRSRFVDH
ncbi:hypothetical protein EYW49_10205 [Siculibacillus lacustris]|uniref:Uncharacterized protein n=1 Tax=Siculibacillus lacustris TaxID=1549641 RepID=A0A4Q9VQ85_9HYPH|nr:hypothetical protein [Siculibacillus lacustris]TBW37977.1 hypothetical protein EYW49_10205 [Siculibacillus lacustris]